MTLAISRQLGRAIDHWQGLGASTRFGIDLGTPPAGTDPALIAAMDAVDRASAAPNYQTWMSTIPDFYTQWQNLSNLAFKYQNEGQLSAALKTELVGRTTWVNNFLTQHSSGASSQTGGSTGSTSGSTSTTSTTGSNSTATSTTTSTAGTGVLDELKTTLANLSTPVKIGGVLVLGYFLLGGHKRR